MDIQTLFFRPVVHQALLVFVVANDDTESPFGRDLDSRRHVSDLDCLKKLIQMMKSESLFKIV
jgi:hypothetical protein